MTTTNTLKPTSILMKKSQNALGVEAMPFLAEGTVQSVCSSCRMSRLHVGETEKDINVPLAY